MGQLQTARRIKRLNEMQRAMTKDAGLASKLREALFGRNAAESVDDAWRIYQAHKRAKKKEGT